MRNDHAFSHPSDVICHHLAYGSGVLAPFPVYDDGSPMDAVGLEQRCADPYPMRSLKDTPVYAKIFLQTAISRLRHPCVLRLLWSDDFEPNNVKNNRSSVWILTMTILVSEHVQTKEHFATFPIAVGPKGSDHVPVMRAISDNIFAMSPEVCPGGVEFHNHRPSLANIITNVSVIANLHDHQERRPVTGLMGGNSSFHARWGYSCHIKACFEWFPMCDACLASAEKSLECLSSISCEYRPLPDCKSCTCWMQDVKHPKLCCPPVDKFPSDFPQTKCDWLSKIAQGVEEGRLLSFKIGFPDLILAVDYAHKQVFMHQWNKGETLKFLEYHCINKHA
jgi:hypothetical protein